MTNRSFSCRPGLGPLLVAAVLLLAGAGGGLADVGGADATPAVVAGDPASSVASTPSSASVTAQGAADVVDDAAAAPSAPATPVQTGQAPASTPETATGASDGAASSAPVPSEGQARPDAGGASSEAAGSGPTAEPGADQAASADPAGHGADPEGPPASDDHAAATRDDQAAPTSDDHAAPGATDTPADDPGDAAAPSPQPTADPGSTASAPVASGVAGLPDDAPLPTYGQSESTRFRRTRGGRTVTSYLMHARGDDVLKTLQEMFADDVSGGELKLTSNPPTNAIIARTKDPKSPLLAEVIDVIQSLDFRAGQVLIDVLVVEFSFTDEKLYDAEFKNLVRNPLGLGETMATLEGDHALTGSSNAQGAPANPLTAATGLKAFITSQNRIKAFLSAMSKKHKVNVVSCPHIVAANHREAKFTIGEKVPLISERRPSDNGTIETFTPQDVAVELTVTPHVNRSREVDLEITQNINAITDYDKVRATARISTRNVTTNLSVSDGQTAVLGGFVQEKSDVTVRKLPILGNLPVLGKAFRFESKSREKTELVVFLTPQIIETTEDAQRVARLTRERVSFRERLDQLLAERKGWSGRQRPASQTVLIERGSPDWLYDGRRRDISRLIAECPATLDTAALKLKRPGSCPFGFGAPALFSTSEVATELEVADGYAMTRTFEVADPAAFRHLILRVASDNAAAVYLNDKLVERDPALTTRDGHDRDLWNRERHDIPASALVAGTNRVTVLLQNDEGITDAFLDLELLGVR